MPHVEIKCYPGRTEEVKTKCAEEVAKAIAETMGLQSPKPWIDAARPLYIPSNILSIGEDAFEGCTGLESIIVSKIGMTQVFD